MCVQSLDQENLLEENMATHSNIFAWKNPMDRGTWQATVHGVTKESGQDSTTKQQQQHELFPLYFLCLNNSLTKTIFGNLRHPSR